MKAKEVLKLLSISRVTLCKYVKTGIIKGNKLPTGIWVYDDDSVFSLIGLKKKKKNKINVSYSRVSTYSQKNQLKDQTQRIYESCISKGIQLDKQIEDIKSGMSFDRKGFNDLCQLIIKGEVELLVIENKDRLMRFGFEGFEQMFKYFGTKILVLSEEIQNKSYEQELTEDLLSIIHYFSMKSYSNRRKLDKMRKELENDIKTNKSIKKEDTN